MKVTKMAFERRYSDDSGVDIAVRYKAGASEQIELQRGDCSVYFDANDIEWLREALWEIAQQLPKEVKS